MNKEYSTTAKITCTRPEFMNILINGFKKEFPNLADVTIAEINVEKDEKKNEFIITLYKNHLRKLGG